VADRDRADYLADDLELLHRDRVRDTDAERHLGARGHDAARRGRPVRAVIDERLFRAEPDAGVRGDAELTAAAEFLVDHAHDLRDEIVVTEPLVLRVDRRQVQAGDDAEAEVRRPAGLEEPRLEVQPDVAEAL